MKFTLCRSRAAVALFLACATPRAWAILGVGDVSFVTVVANPAEASNWIAQLNSLASQLDKLQQTEAQIELLRSQAGDPTEAAKLGEDLTGLLRQTDQLVAEPSDATAIQAANPGDILAMLSAVGLSSTIDVFGSVQRRDLEKYSDSATLQTSLSALRAQIALEQSNRERTQAAMESAWDLFRSAGTESQKQAALTRMEELAAENAIAADRRRALLDDEHLVSDQAQVAAEVEARADDEKWLAQGSALRTAQQRRVQAAETQRLNVINAALSPQGETDYGALKIWTLSDSVSTSP